MNASTDCIRERVHTDINAFQMRSKRVHGVRMSLSYAVHLAKSSKAIFDALPFSVLINVEKFKKMNSSVLVESFHLNGHTLFFSDKSEFESFLLLAIHLAMKGL